MQTYPLDATGVSGHRQMRPDQACSPKLLAVRCFMRSSLNLRGCRKAGAPAIVSAHEKTYLHLSSLHPWSFAASVGVGSTVKGPISPSMARMLELFPNFSRKFVRVIEGGEPHVCSQQLSTHSGLEVISAQGICLLSLGLFSSDRRLLKGST